MSASTAAVLMVGGAIILIGGLWLINNPDAFAQGSDIKALIKEQFGSRGGMDLNEVPEGYESPTLNKIRTKEQLDRSEIGDYLEGIRDEIGANYAYAYPGKKLGQQPNFVPPGLLKKGANLPPGIRRRVRRRGFRSHMAIHYE